MNFWDVFSEMLVILFAIAAGYAANRLGYLGGETDQKVSKLLLNITMPAMIVAAVITAATIMAGMVMFSSSLETFWSVSPPRYPSRLAA